MAHRELNNNQVQRSVPPRHTAEIVGERGLIKDDGLHLMAWELSRRLSHAVKPSAASTSRRRRCRVFDVAISVLKRTKSNYSVRIRCLVGSMKRVERIKPPVGRKCDTVTQSDPSKRALLGKANCGGRWR